jgi:hypothetical protein
MLNIFIIGKNYFKTKDFKIFRSSFLLLGSSILLGLIMITDPGGYLDWFLD